MHYCALHFISSTIEHEIDVEDLVCTGEYFNKREVFTFLIFISGFLERNCTALYHWSLARLGLTAHFDSSHRMIDTHCLHDRDGGGMGEVRSVRAGSGTAQHATSALNRPPPPLRLGFHFSKIFYQHILASIVVQVVRCKR